GCSGMAHLVDLEASLVEQHGRRRRAKVTPSEREGDDRALARDGQLAVMIGECDGEFVGVRAALFGQVKADQARPDLGADVDAIDDKTPDSLTVDVGPAHAASSSGRSSSIRLSDRVKSEIRATPLSMIERCVSS